MRIVEPHLPCSECGSQRRKVYNTEDKCWVCAWRQDVLMRKNELVQQLFRDGFRKSKWFQQQIKEDIVKAQWK